MRRLPAGCGKWTPAAKRSDGPANSQQRSHGQAEPDGGRPVRLRLALAAEQHAPAAFDAEHAALAPAATPPPAAARATAAGQHAHARRAEVATIVAWGRVEVGHGVRRSSPI